ncbi:MAG: hypothetical protein H6779_03895 [Candidatus Nomurabacteria bacterium]|nr:MAG: hypothetical protein H6779_03895 [Candidatus Nomurabacteria bacterium]
METKHLPIVYEKKLPVIAEEGPLWDHFYKFVKKYHKFGPFKPFASYVRSGDPNRSIKGIEVFIVGWSFKYKRVSCCLEVITCNHIPFPDMVVGFQLDLPKDLHNVKLVPVLLTEMWLREILSIFLKKVARKYLKTITLYYTKCLWLCLTNPKLWFVKED